MNALLFHLLDCVWAVVTFLEVFWVCTSVPFLGICLGWWNPPVGFLGTTSVPIFGLCMGCCNPPRGVLGTHLSSLFWPAYGWCKPPRAVLSMLIIYFLGLRMAGVNLLEQPYACSSVPFLGLRMAGVNLLEQS